MQETPPTSSASGPGRRRQRLSDEETERRMLDAASEAVVRSGLTVSLEHIRLEDLIREAGVSRSAVYRRWPHKDLFLGDLLLRLARGQAPMASRGSRAATATVRHTTLRHPELLESAESRQRLVAEILREVTWQDFEHIRGSDDWNTYLALTVTFIGLPAGELRKQVQEELAVSEQAFIDHAAANTRVVANLFGLRPRPELRLSFETVARLSNATLRGLITSTLASPETATHRVDGTLFGASGEWSLPALGVIGIIMTYLEPDPDIEFDREKINRIHELLETTEDLFDDSEPAGSGATEHHEPDTGRPQA